MTATSAVPPALAELAAECGVATGYTDARGAHREVSERTLRAVLAAMDVGTTPPTGSDEDRAALEEIRARRWRRIIAPTVVAREGVSATVPVHIPSGATVTATAHLEHGTTPVSLRPTAAPVSLRPAATPGERRSVDGVPMEQVSLSIPGDLPSGWHRLVVVVEPATSPPASAEPGSRPHHPPAETAEATLLVAPGAIPLPAGLADRPAAGLAAQLYQVRSRGSWGFGDLSDLAELATWAAHDLGADFVLVNPMHAGEPVPPVSPSPYLPTTRRFVSPLYLRPELLPEYTQLPPADRDRVDQLAATAAGTPDSATDSSPDTDSPDTDLVDASSVEAGTAGAVDPRAAGAAGPNTADTIDRDSSWAAKLEALRLLYTVEPSPERAAAFEEFITESGPALLDFATWCTIAEEYGADWSSWPAELTEPHSSAVSRYAEAHSGQVRFHQWLQWTTAEQRARAQQAAHEAGMRVGIIHDLAVGVHPTGADAWSLNQSLARGVSVGAPPDIYNQRGQDWSQPPLRPDTLAEHGYQAFRDIVRAALRDAGGVRIDHILGLFRLWWIPEGTAPTEGTYVHYDSEAMLAVLAIEASRAGAVVIGEDLGTVAPGVREALAERGVLGTSVMWFEQDDDGQPRDPGEYRTLCMASVTTHDLVPTAGYAELVHVEVRDQLGQLTRGVEVERADAAAEVDAFVSEVRARGLLTSSSSEDLVVALHEFVAESPSVLLAVSVADLVGDRRGVNVPGTDREYPNWTVPLSDGAGHVVGLEQLTAGGLPVRVFEAIDRARES